MKIKAALIVFSFLLLLSCAKKPNAEVDNETQSVLDFSNSSRDFITIIQAAQQAIINTPGAGSNQTKGNFSNCETLTKIAGDTLWGTTGHVNPTFTLDVSSDICGALIPDSKKHQGQLSIRLTDKFQNPGAITIIKSTGYWTYYNETALVTRAYQMCDSIVLKTISSNASSVSFEMVLVNGKIIQNTSGKISQLNFTLQISTTVSIGLITNTDLFGTVKGTNINGLAYKVDILQATPLKKDKSCNYFNTGEAYVMPDGFKPRTVNYGKGTCDDNANFTVNENTIAFKLK